MTILQEYGGKVVDDGGKGYKRFDKSLCGKAKKKKSMFHYIFFFCI